MLLAVEVLIVGIAIAAIRGTAGGGWTFGGTPIFAMGLHHTHFTAAPIAPIEAGSSPRVAIDDADSRVVVGTSTDGQVHVKDLTTDCTFFGTERTPAKLQVQRTADGVSIVRPQHTGGWGFEIGMSTEKIEVDVPQDAHVEIARSSGANVTGIVGGVNVHSVDGHIELADLRGTVDARSDDGYISARSVRGDALTLHSADGHLSLTDVAVATLNAHTSDGRIEATGLSVGSGEISTNDGRVYVTFAPGSNLTVDASTSDGKVYVDGNSHGGNDDSDVSHHTFQLGSGSGNLKISSSDGSIHLTTNSGA